MPNFKYLFSRMLTRWKRTRVVGGFLAKRIMFRFLDNVPILSGLENVTPKPLSIAPNSRVLLLAPHSDDESIGCGGMLIRYHDQVEVVCLTDGRLADPSVPMIDLVSMRENELASAMAIAKVSRFRFLSIPDQQLMQGYNRFSELSLQGIDWIFLPSFLDQHPDHKAVTYLLQQLLQDKGYEPSLQIAFYEIWGALPVWNAFIDLDDALWDKKKTMVNCFLSQVKHIDYASRIQGLHRYRGITVDKSMAEAYLLLSVEDFLKIR